MNLPLQTQRLILRGFVVSTLVLGKKNSSPLLQTWLSINLNLTDY